MNQKQRNQISMKDILEYEIHSHWLVKHISFSWGQDLMVWYMVRKVRKKHKRYLLSLKSLENLKNIKIKQI